MVSNHVPLDKLVRDVAGDLSDILGDADTNNKVFTTDPTSSMPHYVIRATIPSTFAVTLYFKSTYAKEPISPYSAVLVNRVASLRANLRKSEVPDIPAAQQTYEKIKQYLAGVAGKDSKITQASWRAYWVRQLLTDIATSNGIFVQTLNIYTHRTKTGLRYYCEHLEGTGESTHILSADDGFSGLHVTSNLPLEQLKLPRYSKRLGKMTWQMRFK